MGSFLFGGRREFFPTSPAMIGVLCTSFKCNSSSGPLDFNALKKVYVACGVLKLYDLSRKMHNNLPLAEIFFSLNTSYKTLAPGKYSYSFPITCHYRECKWKMSTQMHFSF